MSQCLQCHQPCAENAICCDTCQARSEKALSQEMKRTPAGNSLAMLPVVFTPEALVWAEQEAFTLPYVEADGPGTKNANAQIPLTPLASNDQQVFDQTASRLSAAARGIKADESGIKRLR